MEKKKALNSLMEHLSQVKDPRAKTNQDHKLIDILMIAVCAIISGAEHFTEFEKFGKAKNDWFQTFLELPHGIPSHDTFNRFFILLNPKIFQEVFLAWTKSLRESFSELISIDGKTLRRSHSKAKNKSAIVMVSAWCAQNKMVLAQVKTEEKSNEITAIPELLRALDLNGCIVTIDAIGTQKAIAEQICEQGGDYILPVKENQKNLRDGVEKIFLCASDGKLKEYGIEEYVTEEKCHGRRERRVHWTTSKIEDLEMKGDWRNIKSIGVVSREREVGEKKSEEYCYYISSLDLTEEKFAESIRGHWQIENNLHWQLDVSFNEDLCRVREGHGDENLAILRHIALNLLKKDTSNKVGIKSKQKCCGWDNNYLARILSLKFDP